MNNPEDKTNVDEFVARYLERAHALPDRWMRVVAHDDLGYLWADGAAIPRLRTPNPSDENPGAVLCHTEDGLGVWIHTKSLPYLQSVSRLDMEVDRWTPINVVLTELPGFIKATQQES